MPGIGHAIPPSTRWRAISVITYGVQCGEAATKVKWVK
jgi:hypothetical protein